MSAQIELLEKQPTMVGRWVVGTYHFFLRLLSIAFIAFTIHIWLTAIGYWEGANFRFDTMEWKWKIYTAVLLVLNPVTSVGLWTTLSWGRVVWFLAAGFQIIAWLSFKMLPALGLEVIYFHLITLAIYLIFQIALYLINKEA